MTDHVRGEVVWTPGRDRLVGAGLTKYAAWLGERYGCQHDGYADLWRWSTRDVGRFWSTIWDYFDVLHSVEPTAALVGGPMPGVTWFPGARLNYAENALRWTGPQEAVVSWDETGRQSSLSRDELRDRVARAAAGLARLGVGPGDRVAGYLPNIPETLIALLATASLGAIWSCCPTEYGTSAVLDRFLQIKPRVLIVSDGYVYRGRKHDRRDVAAEVLESLPDTEVVWVNRLFGGSVQSGIGWDELSAEPAELRFEQVEFGTPLWILYSSGSTGRPKGIVHSHGGIVLEHLKSMALQVGITEGTRALQYTSSGWVMWNIHIGGLLTGATIMLYDGAADVSRPDYLWEMVSTQRADAFGTSPAYLARCVAAGARPGEEFDLRGLQTIGSTGSVLPAEMYHWVFERVAPWVFLRSTSGGTDVATSILGCAPVLPTRAGEIQCLPLGVAAAAFDAGGRPLAGQPGDLVVTAPMPSMPVALWGDETGSRLRDTYFNHYPGIWRHGDWVTVYEDGASVVHGRSDATLNRGGIRIGTAEIYRIMDAAAWIRDCVVVDVPAPGPGHTSQLVLLVVAEDGASLDQEFVSALRAQISVRLSPRHVPDRIVAVPALPRTANGKRLEVPVRDVLMGKPADESASAGAVARFSALEEIARHRDAILGWSHPETV